MFLAIIAVLAVFIGSKLPSSFLPDEDQGYLFVGMQLPDAASLQRTSDAAVKVEHAILGTPGVESCVSVVGFSLLSGTQSTYTAFFFVTLKDWDKRKAPNEQYKAIQANVGAALSKVQDGIAFSFPPPAIPGVGSSGGVSFVLEDRSGSGNSFLAEQTTKFLAAARKRPEFAGMISTFEPEVPQVYVDVDQAKVLRQSVNLADVYATMQTFMGGYLVNYFNRFGRQWQVYVEAEGDSRTRAQNVGEFTFRTATEIACR